MTPLVRSLVPVGGNAAAGAAPDNAGLAAAVAAAAKRRRIPDATLPELNCELLHVSRGTIDVARLADFYRTFLGLQPCPAGASAEEGVVWLELPPGARLRISNKSRVAAAESPLNVSATAQPTLDPYALRRGHRLSFRIVDIARAKQALTKASIEYRAQDVPGDACPPICQLFFFDPDGNGIELTNTPPTLPPFADNGAPCGELNDQTPPRQVLRRDR